MANSGFQLLSRWRNLTSFQEPGGSLVSQVLSNFQSTGKKKQQRVTFGKANCCAELAPPQGWVGGGVGAGKGDKRGEVVGEEERESRCLRKTKSGPERGDGGGFGELTNQQG